MQSGQYILGPQVQAFEEEFAAWCQADHAVAVASGTDALVLILHALGVAGGEVITSAHTAVATLAAIERAGGTPVLADIDPVSRCLDPRSVRRLVGGRTRAVVVVHIYGHPADLEALGALVAGTGIALVEDCAQAHGAAIGGRPVGALAVAGAFSFYPTKNLGAMGDAGAVVTNDAELAHTIRGLRQYGWNRDRVCEYSGHNSRMDEVQAAVLRLKLDSLTTTVERRRWIAARYDNALRDSRSITSPRVAPGASHAYHLYVVEAEQREALEAFMSERGIETMRHYALPSYRHPAYQDVRRDGEMSKLEKLYRMIVSIPVFAELTDGEVDVICGALRDWTALEAGR
jgi:dTDP-4-amino-4,6-dideoxygalactose transaminase